MDGLLSILSTEARDGEHPFVTLCRARNREFEAPPGVALPDAAAAAMADFIFLVTCSLQRS